MDNRARILVVDDDPQILRFLSEALQGMEVEPYCVESSSAAAGLVQDKVFEGIILDWQMPGMSGMQLARTIRESKLNAHCPIVMLTGHPSPEVVQESLNAGINFFLPKPVSLDQLRNLVDPRWGFLAQERRRSQRAPVRLQVVCQWNDHRANGQVLNLSSEGARMVLEEAPPMYSWVSVRLRLPGYLQPVELTGQVVNVTFAARSPRGRAVRHVGLRFVGLNSETAGRIASGAQYLLPGGHA